MISNIVIIPARSGSVRLPNKNVLPFGPFSLLSWNIGTALSFFGEPDSLVYVSSDSEEYIKHAEDQLVYPCPRRLRFVHRPKELATATATTAAVIADVFQQRSTLKIFKEVLPTEFNLVLWQVTSPFRDRYRVSEAIAYAKPGHTAVTVDELGRPTGNLYVSRVSLTSATKLTEMSVANLLLNRLPFTATDEHELVDIDVERDYHNALRLLPSIKPSILVPRGYRRPNTA